MSLADYIAAFRQANPDYTAWSDESILDRFAYEYRDQLDQHPELKQWAQQRRKEYTTPWEEAKGAVASGVDRAQAQVFDTARLAGRVAGLESVERWGAEGYERNRSEAANYEPAVAKFEDIRTPGDFGYWLTNILGSNAPQIVGTAAAAGAAAAAAPQTAVGAGATGLARLGVLAGRAIGLGAGKEAAAGLSAKAVAGLAGASAAGFTQMQNYGDLVESGGENAVPLAIANGLIGAVLEAYGPARMVRTAVGAGIKKAAAENLVEKGILQDAAQQILLRSTPGPLMSVALNAAKEGATEMLTEMAQEATTVATEYLAHQHDPKYEIDQEQFVSRLLNSGVAGFVLGGAGGAVAKKLGLNDPGQEPTPPAITGTSSVQQPASYTVPIDQPSTAAVAAANQARQELLNKLAVAQPAAPVTTGSPNPKATVSTGATATVLATPESQARLVSEFQFSQPEAAAIPEEEAQRLFAEREAQLARQKAEADAAAQAEQERRIAEEARLQEQERQLAEAADRQIDQQNLDIQQQVEQGGRELEAQAARALKPQRVSKALKTPPTTVPAPQPGPAVLNATIASQQPPAQTMAPVTPQRISSEAPTSVQGSPTSETAAAASAPAAPAVAPAPASTATPLEVSHGLHGIDELTARRFIPRDRFAADDSAAFRAASLGDTHDLTARYHVFLHKDGTREIRKASMTGRLAVRENQEATPNKIAALLKEKANISISPATITKILRGGESRFGVETNTLVRDVAKKLGYGAEGHGLDPVTWATQQGLVWEGTIEAERDAKLRHIEKNVTPQQWESFRKRTTESADLRKTGVRVSDAVVTKLAEMIQSDPTIIDRMNAGTPIEANLVQRTVFETALEVATPEERSRFKTMFDAGSKVAYDRVAGAFARAIEKVAPQKGSEAPAKNIVPDETGVVFPEIRVEHGAAVEWARKIRQHQGGFTKIEKLIAERTPAAQKTIDGLLMQALDDQSPKRFRGLNAKQAKFQEAVASNPAQADRIRELFRGSLLDAVRDLKSREQTEESAPAEKVWHRRGSSEDYLGKEDDAEKRFNAVLREIAARGGKVALRQVMEDIGRGGVYIPSKREVHLLLKNVVRPTIEDLLTSIHEAVHMMTEGQPQWLRRALQDTFERLPNADLAFYRNPKADPKVSTGQNVENLPREQYLMERAVEHATLQGVDRQYAQGVIPAIWRAFKDMLLKAAIYLQGTIMGPENVGGNLAKAWLENTTAAFLAGDAGSFNNFLASLGRSPTHAQILRYTTDGEHVMVNEIDPDTGVPVVRENWDLTDAAEDYRTSALLDATKAKLIHDGTLDAIAVENELREILNQPDALFSSARTTALSELARAMSKTIADKRVTVAVANQVARLVERLFQAVKAVNPDLGRENILALRKIGEAVPEDLTLEIFRKRLGLPDSQKVVEKALSTLKAQIKLETGDDVDPTAFVSPGITIDDLPKEMQDVANNAFLNAITKFETRIEKLKIRLSEQSANLSTDLEARRQAIQESTKKLHEWKSTERDVLNEVIALVRTLKRGGDQMAKAADKEGYARATIESLLEKEIDAFDTEFSEDLLESMNLGDLPLGAIFRQLFALERDTGIDLGSISPRELRSKIIDEVALKPASDLKHLLGDGPRDTKANALFASIHAFIKKEAREVAVVRLQLDDTVQRSEQIIEVRAALKEGNESTLTEIMERVRKDLKRPGNRVIYETLKEREQALKGQKRIAEVDRTITFFGRVSNGLRESAIAAQQRIGVLADWDLKPGGMIFNPTSPDMPSEQVIANQATLGMDLGEETTLEQIEEIRRNMQLWLDARKDDPNAQDTVYRTMQRQRDRLKLALIDKNSQMLTGLKNGYFQNLAEQMDRTGLRGGRLLARLIRRLESEKRAADVASLRNGKEVERTRHEFMRAAGIKNPEWEKEYLYDESIFFLRRAFGTDAKDAFPALRAHLQKHTNDVVRNVALNEGLWRLYEKRLRAAEHANAYMIRLNLEKGNRVRDEGIKVAGRAALRNPIERGAPGFTFMTRLHHRIGATLASWGMKNVRMVLDGSPTSPLADAPAKIRTDPGSFEKDVDAFFDHQELQEVILRPLFCDNDDPDVPAPDNKAGLQLVVPAWLASQAYEDSHGRVLEAARRIFQATGASGTKEALEEYQIKVLTHVINRIKKLAQRANLEEPTERITLTGIAHVAMDSVMEEDFKREWVTFPDFSVEENRANAHIILTNAIFGRNLEVVRGAVLQVDRDLKQFVLPATSEERARLKSSDLKRYQQIEEAVRVRADWIDDDKILKAFASEANPETDPASTQIGIFMELFSTVAQLMLSGLRTGLRDLSSLTAPIQLERSLSLPTLERTVSMHGRAAKLAFGSVLNQLFGANTLGGNWRVQAMEEVGLGDPIRGLEFKDYILGTYGKGDHFEKTASGKFQRLLRMARTVVANQRIGIGKDAIGPQFRAHFHAWLSQVQRFAATMTYIDTVVSLSRRAAAFYAEHPTMAGQPLTAKQIGYMDGYGYRMLTHTLGEYGLRIEEIAQRLVQNPKLRNQDLLTKDDLISIHSMAQAKVMGESGADTRPHALPLGLGRDTRGGRVGQTFIGWSFWKSGEAWNMLRDENGRRNLESVTRGAMAMVLGLLPLGIAASLAIDLYDEKLTKKRANWMAYHSGMSPEDFIQVTLQRAAQMGTLGLPGEILSNFITPTDQSGQRPLAVDQRIVWLNAIRQFYQSLRTLNAVGFTDANYANVGRQMMASLGMGGLLQNIQLVNGVLGPVDLPLFKGEASVTARINMNNFLRAAGTQLKFELRPMGASTALPNELTPNVTDMLLASLSNDRAKFIASYKKALVAATKLPGVTDPEKKVRESFESRNPLRNMFRMGAVTEEELAMLLRIMPDQGREAVVQGLQLINSYGQLIGAKPFTGTTRERKNAALIAAAARHNIPRSEASMDAVTRAQRAAAVIRDDSGF